MTERVSKEDLKTDLRFRGEITEAARIRALGDLAIAQAIDGLTTQVKRMIDDEMGPEIEDD
jgi:hypothetical protein